MPVAEAPLGGPFRLAGEVVAADDGSPVRRAYVSLSGVPDTELDAGPARKYVSRRVELDPRGRFEFADLPPGSYSVAVEPTTGFVRPVRARAVRVADGQHGALRFRLPRTGAIEGRVQDEYGEGLLGARVQAIRFQELGNRFFAAGAAAATDDRGHFRIFDLAPGQYYVVATHAPRRFNDLPPRAGYTTTYYPGANAIGAAKPVTVRAGRDTGAIGIALAPRPLVRLDVRAVDASGAPLPRNAVVSLTRRDEVYLADSMRSPQRSAQGVFGFDGLTPGVYSLIVAASVEMQEAAYVDVSIGDDDVSMDVRTNAGARISGRVIVDGAPIESGSEAARLATVAAYPPVGAYGVAYARVPLASEKDGRFELTGLRGPMALHADIAGGALLTIRRSGEELAGRTLTFAGTETIDDVVVEFTTRVAALDVTVAGTQPPDDPEPVLIVLFADDPARRHAGYVQYARATASRPPSRTVGASAGPEITRLSRMPPGSYRVVAIHDADLSYPGGAATLERLRPLSVPVTLAPDQPASVTLHVVPFPPR